jgi:hypothetical protein
MRCLLILILWTAEGPKQFPLHEWYLHGQNALLLFSIYQQVQICIILPNITRNNETWTICIIWTTKLTHQTTSPGPNTFAPKRFRILSNIQCMISASSGLGACLSNINDIFPIYILWCVFHTYIFFPQARTESAGSAPKKQNSRFMQYLQASLI